MNQTNRCLVLDQRFDEMPDAQHFRIETTAIPEPVEGEVLLRVLYASIDPAMYNWINSKRPGAKLLPLGQVMRARTVAQVVASRHDAFSVGDLVTSLSGICEYAISNGRDLELITPAAGVHPATYLGTLGMSGLSAYFGLLRVGQPQAGQCVVVSAAAGSVGSMVGQIARIMGCRVVGITGSQEKCRYLEETLGFDAALNYRQEDLEAQLQQACPDGVDVFFDNVGGTLLDQVLMRLNRHARVVLCGAISQYLQPTIKGPDQYLALLYKEASMQGFLVVSYRKEFPEAYAALANWLQSGQLIAREELVQGIAEFPRALRMLFEGKNLGKLVLGLGE